jgi:hypothetical protein
MRGSQGPCAQGAVSQAAGPRLGNGSSNCRDAFTLQKVLNQKGYLENYFGQFMPVAICRNLSETE